MSYKEKKNHKNYGKNSWERKKRKYKKSYQWRTFKNREDKIYKIKRQKIF